MSITQLKTVSLWQGGASFNRFFVQGVQLLALERLADNPDAIQAHPSVAV